MVRRRGAVAGRHAVNLPGSVARRLAQRRSQGLFRTLPTASRLVDLSSNDFLGFAEDAVLRERLAAAMADLPLGATASRLVRNAGTEAIDATEAALARFFSRSAGLLFPSGYQANLGLLAALMGPEHTVFSDALNHASLIDGMRLSGARRVVYRHCDPDDLERHLKAAPTGGERYVVTESVFSMDGDLAPLADLLAVAERYGAHVLVDEAHATGLLGGGAGAVAAAGLSERVLATVHTGGKALGVAGGFVACDVELVEALVNLSRPFVYSTGVMPALAVALRLAVERFGEVGAERAAVVLKRAQWLYERTCALPGLDVCKPAAAIVPVLTGADPSRAVALSATLAEAGYDVRAYRPPTVPEGTSRLRLTARHPVDEAQLEGAMAALVDAMAALRRTRP